MLSVQWALGCQTVYHGPICSSESQLIHISGPYQETSPSCLHLRKLINISNDLNYNFFGFLCTLIILQVSQYFTQFFCHMKDLEDPRDYTLHANLASLSLAIIPVSLD